jgi:hypothetical protein
LSAATKPSKQKTHLKNIEKKPTEIPYLSGAEASWVDV